MLEKRRLYPIGQQDFPSLRKRGDVYVDKTEYVYRMTHSDSKYMFLSRPRRFGKSLLISTLHAYFEGRRELFEGLAIESLEKDWEPYPVIRLDMSLAKHEEPEARTARGRVDLVMRSKTDLYLMETKLNDNARAAMHQIDLKDYAARFALCGFPVIKVGINSDSGQRTISDWQIETQ